MENTLRVINELEAQGVIGRYAIGGAIGFLFYTEPVLTDDLDIFCHLAHDGALINLGPLYKRLADQGYVPQEGHVIIEGVPVQFLPPTTKLVEEALTNAVDEKFANVTTRVFQYEHLLAIAAETGRQKDKLRIAMALESRAPDESKLKGILQSHGLLDKWSKMRS